MAEALVIIGGLSAIVQLTGCLMKLTKELRACISTLRSAPEEIKSFILETSIFTESLMRFHGLASESQKTGRDPLVRKIVRQCRYVKRGFTDLVNRFIEVNGADTLSLNSLRARILWFLKKPDVQGLRMSLQSAIANVTLLCSFFTFEEAIKKNENDKTLELLRDQLRIWISTARDLRHELVEQKRRKQVQDRMSDIAPDESYDVIVDDTRELEKFVVNAIRSQAARRVLASKGGKRAPHPGTLSPTKRKTWVTPSSGSGTAMARVGDSEGASHGQHSTYGQNLDGTAAVHSPHSPQNESTPSAVDANVTEMDIKPLEIRKARRPPPASPKRSHTIVGGRVRDGGQDVYVDKWPAKAHGSGVESTYTTVDENINELQWIASQSRIKEGGEEVKEQRERNEVVPSASNSGPPQAAHSGDSQPSGPVEEHENRWDPSTGSRNSRATEPERPGQSRCSSVEDDPTPYKPVPPFGGPGSRRRPRRPRPQLPID
ncbi:hypothetical protein AAE478_006848 [Parahypoxylon ruwenzoriense]